MRSDVQKLVDICFQLVGVTSDPQHRMFFDRLTHEQKMEWVAGQLHECGFPTVPCGASWGVLADDMRRTWGDDEVTVSYYEAGVCGDVDFSGPGIRESDRSPHYWVMHDGKPALIRFAKVSPLAVNCTVAEWAKTRRGLDKLREAVTNLTGGA